MVERDDDQNLNDKKVLHKKLEAAGWSLFFIWAGIAFFAHVGWGAGLIGVGIIIFGIQATRIYLGLKLEGFWVAVGFFFTLGGIWEVFHIQFGLLPILCIAAGVFVLGSAFVRHTGDSTLGKHS